MNTDGNGDLRALVQDFVEFAKDALDAIRVTAMRVGKVIDDLRTRPTTAVVVSLLAAYAAYQTAEGAQPVDQANPVLLASDFVGVAHPPETVILTGSEIVSLSSGPLGIRSVPKPPPQSLIKVSVAVNRYCVSRKAIYQDIKDGFLTDHRRPGHGRNAMHLIDEKELARRWLPKPKTICEK